jgi:hypothetical protein
MVWMTAVSFWRNMPKYFLAIVGLALAITVSCVGLSALDALWEFAMRPVSYAGGGQVYILDNRTNLYSLGSRLHAEAVEIKPFPASWAEEVISGVPGHDEAVRTLMVPILLYQGDRLNILYLGARDGLPGSLSFLRLLDGEPLDPESPDTTVLMPGEPVGERVLSYLGGGVGAHKSWVIPEAVMIGEVYDWDLASTSRYIVTVDGIYDGKAAIYNPGWTKLPDLQSRIAAEELVSWVGIPCSLDGVDALKARLEERIAERGLPLKVHTVLELGRVLIGDFERFERMATYYTPVMLFVAIQIVLVNAIALALSRRKDLALLRTIGISIRQIQVMFVLECILSAVLGGLLGTGLSAVLSLSVAQNAVLNLTPFVLTLVATTVVSTIAVAALTRGSLSQVLRNPAG